MRRWNRREAIGAAALTAASTLAAQSGKGGPAVPAPVGSGAAAEVPAFRLSADESRGSGPWVLAGKFPVAAKVSGGDTASRYAILQLEQPAGAGTPLHTHPQNEWVYVLRGVIGVQLGQQRFQLKAGESAMVPRGTEHGVITLGTEAAHLLFLYDPAGSMEGFFADLAEATPAGGDIAAKKLEKLYEQHGMKVTGPTLMMGDFAPPI